MRKFQILISPHYSLALGQLTAAPLNMLNYPRFRLFVTLLIRLPSNDSHPSYAEIIKQKCLILASLRLSCISFRLSFCCIQTRRWRSVESETTLCLFLFRGCSKHLPENDPTQTIPNQAALLTNHHTCPRLSRFLDPGDVVMLTTIRGPCQKPLEHPDSNPRSDCL